MTARLFIALYITLFISVFVLLFSDSPAGWPVFFSLGSPPTPHGIVGPTYVSARCAIRAQTHIGR
jgi:hypothetical protein